MTMPAPDSDRDVQPLGGEVAPPADPGSQGGSEDDGIAGPSFPPAESEPDAH
jgi:hypothetical protein